MKPKLVLTGSLVRTSTLLATCLLAVPFAGPTAQAAVHYQTLRSFGGSFPDLGSWPSALIQGSDAALYGTTSSGGAYSRGDYVAGTVFKVNKDGSGYRVLYNFGGTNNDGLWPRGLFEGNDGALYGTTWYGGAYTNQDSYGYGDGTAFKMNKDGTGYRVLYNFGGTTNDGASPFGLIEGSDGALYGTTYLGGVYTNQYSYGAGTVFKMNKDGTSYRVLYNFGSTTNDGISPSGLIEGSDGALYGTTWNEGAYTNQYGAGTVFKVNKDGSGYRVLYSFGGTNNDGLRPRGLFEGSDGALYGTTAGGGAYTNQYGGLGTAFKLNKDGTGYGVLYNFGGTTNDGMFPGGLLEGSDGALYGHTFDLLSSTNRGTLFKVNKDGSGEVVLHSFWSGGEDGQNPKAALVEGSDGALYGSTSYGGADDVGTVFKLNQDGSGYSLLHSFAFPATIPHGALILGTNGALYGTTRGGLDIDIVDLGAAVFKLNQDGSGYSVLHASTNYDAVAAGLVQGTDGAIYARDYNGVFKLNEDGSGYTVVLSSFDVGFSFGDHDIPLLQGSDGALYGTASEGFFGTVFKLNRNGGGYTVLHSFSFNQGSDGTPIAGAGLLEGSDGALYGTTYWGGLSTNAYGSDTVFKLKKDGSGYAVLYNFGSTASDGHYPHARLIEGSDGALYGTTSGGGPHGDPNGNAYGYGGGTAFKLNKDGSSYSVLYSFGSTSSDGQSPSGLLKGTDGAFYGTTSYGGINGQGTLFKLWPPETPDLTGVTTVGNTLQVTFAGAGGYQYQVLRSTDLTNWSVLATITMPASGVYTNIDSTPPKSAAYYRAAWVR